MQVACFSNRGQGADLNFQPLAVDLIAKPFANRALLDKVRFIISTASG